MKSFLSSIARTLILGALCLATLAGCEKWSHNGYLDGQWQILSVSDAGREVQFPEDEIYYYCFYLHTFQLTYTGHRPLKLSGNLTYDKNDDKIGLELGFVKEGQVNQSTLDRFVYWGMPVSGEVVMTIKELTSSRLVMEHGDVVITCRKF